MMTILSSLFLLPIFPRFCLHGDAFQYPSSEFQQSIQTRAKSLEALRRSINENNDDTPTLFERRDFMRNVVTSQILMVTSLTFTNRGSLSSAVNLDGLPSITHKVFLDVRMSRSDGTFYVRDSVVSPDSQTADLTEEPFYGRLVLGLFGEIAPNHVQQFLKYVEVPFDVDHPLPSYSRSRFSMLDTSSGLLIGGTIPGLDVTILAGSTVIEYGERVIPAKLWLEQPDAKDPNRRRLSHDRKGLLTHGNFDLTPSFGITTRNDSISLDSSHTVFGCIIEDAGGFLEKVLDVPLLTDSGKVSRTEITDTEPSRNIDLGVAVASSVFTTQRKIFRDAAKTFGDSRLDKVYDGKLLRRIEVTKVGVL